MVNLWRGGGALPIDPAADREALMPQLSEGLRSAGCTVEPGPGRVKVVSGSPGRGSVFSFVDGGAVWLEQAGGRTVLRYEFSTVGGFRTCVALSLFAGTVSWFTLGDGWLTAFGFAAPILWLYGANYVMSALRVPARLHRMCVSRG